MLTRMTKQYVGVARSVGLYFKHYGGLGALFGSPYFHVSILIAALLAPNWVERDWFEVVIQTLPNIVGFSIGGYAVWLGFGDHAFRKLMAGANANSQTSPYLIANATFAHFITIQVIALLAAIIAKALDFVPANDGVLLAAYNLLHVTPDAASATLRIIGAFISLTLFFYALALIFATVFALMKLASLFERFQSLQDEQQNPPAPPINPPATNPAVRESANDEPK